MFKLFLFVCLFSIINADLLTQSSTKRANLKPLSVCCDIPDLLTSSTPINECSNQKAPGVCNDVQCVFEKSGFLIDRQSLNKEAYRNHLLQWVENHKAWSEAIEKVIQDCVNKDLRQYLDYPCRAYDVFSCTGIAMIKKCPKEAWKC